MSYRQLDDKGKPLPRDGRTSRRSAKRLERGKELFHYEIAGAIPQPGGGRLQYRKRFWLSGDDAAAAKEREILRKPPAEALTWTEAHRLWVEANRARFSAGHIANSEITIRQWCEAFGAASTIEDTTLAAFSGWVEDKARVGTGRGAQIKRGHLLAIARWCRARGLVETIPFRHAPQPVARSRKRRAATSEEFRRIAGILPPHMRLMWLLLGLTGMRISAACDLVESDITERDITVTTKGSKRVTYAMTPELSRIIADARAFKAGGYVVGTGRNRRDKPMLTDNLFCTHRGGTWNKSSYNNQLQRRLEKAGLPAITAHQLRHMAGTLAAERGLSADIIQALLGHEDRESSEVYIDKTPAMRSQGLAAVADSLQIFDMESAQADEIPHKSSRSKSNENKWTICPHCGGKVLVDK